MIKIIIKNTKNFLKKKTFNSFKFYQKINSKNTKFYLNKFSLTTLLNKIIINKNF